MIDLLDDFDIERGNDYPTSGNAATPSSYHHQNPQQNQNNLNNNNNNYPKTPNQHKKKTNNVNKHRSGYYSNNASSKNNRKQKYNNNNTNTMTSYNNTTTDMTSNELMDDTASIMSVGGINDTFSQINNAIVEIENAANTVDTLTNVKKNGLPNQQKDAIKRVDSITVFTTSLIHKVKKMMIEAQKTRKEEYLNKEIGETQWIWFQNMYNAMIKKYQNSIWKFQQSTQLFKDSMKQDFVRQAKIIQPNITQQQIQVMLESSDPAKYLQQQMMAVDGQLLDDINELEDEHSKLQKLEKTMLELQEMFNSCAALVADFQEHLDVIESNVDKTKIHVKKGKKQLKQGEVYIKQARKTRVKTTICCLFLLLVIAFLILGPLLDLIKGPWTNSNSLTPVSSPMSQIEERNADNA